MSHSKVLCKYYLFHHKTKSIFHHNSSIFHHTTKSISHHKMKSIFHHTTKSIFHHEHTTKSIFHHAVKSSNRFLAPLCDAVGSFGRVLQTLLSCCITAVHQFSSLESRTAVTASRSTPATPGHFKGFTDWMAGQGQRCGTCAVNLLHWRAATTMTGLTLPHPWG